MPPMCCTLAVRAVVMDNPLAADLDHVLVHTEGLWEDLRGRRVFIAGGTGFFGCWLLESFLWANEKLSLGASATVLTRNPDAFRAKAPHLATHPALALYCGDVTDFVFPAGEYSHVINAATEASAQLARHDPLLMWRTIVAGTQRTLEFAVRCGAARYLLTSSGAVYGKQPAELSRIPEHYLGGPDATDASSAYAEGKRAAETLCALYASEHGIEATIARCFAFVGPYLPLDRHFAVGNFIRDALGGGPIRVNGDGSPYRSYLYAADLAIWLWTILVRGEGARPYNVGSADAVTIAETAEMVAAAVQPRLEVVIARRADPRRPPERYVPSVERAAVELNLNQAVALPDAVGRTIAWHQRRLHPVRKVNSLP